MGTRYATMATHSGRGGRLLNGVYYRYSIAVYVDKDLELTFKGKVNYHTTAHRALKWSRFIPKVG